MMMLSTKLEPLMLEYVADTTVPCADALKPNKFEISHTKDEAGSESQFESEELGDLA